MICELCDYWFHIGCQQISINEYKLYNHEDHKAPWFCKQCYHKFRQLSKEHKEVKTENSSLRTENLDLKKANAELMEH